MANTSQTALRMSGYLEKKAKLRLGSPWKKYWFVLEGRLLLYYRSKDEYETLSPCKGSINLCPPCNIKPAQSITGVFQIECRSNTIILRAEDRAQQERWMQALLAAIAQTQCNSNRMSHFRYSLDDLPIPNQTNKSETLSRQNTMPYRLSISSKKESKDIIERLQKIGAQTYRVSFGTVAKLSKKDGSDEIQKSQSVKQIPVLLEDQYSIIQEENSMEMYLEDKSQSNNSATCLTIDNEHYVTSAEENNLSDSDQIRDRKGKNHDEHLYERITKQYYNPNELIINEDYSTIIKNKEPELAMIIVNDQYITTIDDEEELYANRLLYNEDCEQYYAIDNAKEALYEDPDRFKKKEILDTEPLLPPRPDVKKTSEDVCSQASSNEDGTKKKSRFLFRHLKRATEKKFDDGYKKKPKGRSSSFLKRVWKRKTKSLDCHEDGGYETIDYEMIQKQIQHDKNDLQMLQELQKILETRKNLLQEKLKSSSQRSVSVQCPMTTIPDSKNEGHEPCAAKHVEEGKPNLPPKQSLCVTESSSDTLNNNEIKSLDEILKDLDKEKQVSESKKKVKKLIEKFNEFQSEDDVTLRRKSKPQLNFIIGAESTNRHSEGLNELLEELSKVTYAPVLTPGVTSSLVTPILTDDEWLELMPIRNRRMSDPDYDIPRPHRSLQLPVSTNIDQPISGTRFFGPVLTSENATQNTKTCSIDPDSLEIHPMSKCENDGNVSSYISHNYKDVVYSQPKSLLSIRESANDTLSSCDIASDDVVNNTDVTKEEIYVDSLEPLVEISTAF